MADTRAFFRLLDELRSLNTEKEINLWYTLLGKPFPQGNKEGWDKMSEKDKKLLVKNINEKKDRLKNIKKSFLSKKDWDYLASMDNTAGIDRKTVIYEIKKFILPYIVDFKKRIKSGIKNQEISSMFHVLSKQLGDIKSKVEGQMEIASLNVKSNDLSKIGKKYEPDRLIAELKTLFELPLKGYINEIKSGTMTDQEIFNVFDSMEDVAKTWSERTAW